MRQAPLGFGEHVPIDDGGVRAGKRVRRVSSGGGVKMQSGGFVPSRHERHLLSDSAGEVAVRTSQPG
jgi:hypothetical protein